MQTSIPQLLLVLWGKCLLNWLLVFSQKKRPVCRSFMGAFGVSLALVDTILTLTLTALQVQADRRLWGVRLTRHHVCLLAQIVGQIYGALQWPVVVLGFLDCYIVVRGRGTTTTTTPTTSNMNSRERKLAPVLLATALLWYAATFYVFLLSDYQPVLSEEALYHLHRCMVLHSSQALHVAAATVLAVACTLVYSHMERRTTGAGCSPREFRDGVLSRRDVVQQAVMTLLCSWAPLLVLLAVLLLLQPVTIPGYLSMNVPWLCYLNSVLTAVVLGSSCPASRREQGLAAFPLDSFCDWRLGSTTGDLTNMQHGTEECSNSAVKPQSCREGVIS